jgi:predicted GNAT superfamily acetyltransferase
MIIRRIETIEEYKACETLVEAAWGTGPEDAVPAHLLLTIQGEGGVVLGAFTDKDLLIGFVMGFLSREGNTLKHHSHMAGVHPAHRDKNIAYRLKLAQRAWCLEQGLELMTWTYDPLEARNAALNIAKLGATANIYKRNVYGQSLGPLNLSLPTDRFMVRWELNSPRVVEAVSQEQRVQAPVAEQIVSHVEFIAGQPVLMGTAPPPDNPLIGFQFPASMQALKQNNPAAALDWRMGSRAFFEGAFAAGYRVVNLTRDARHPDGLALYTLSSSGE